MLICFKNAKTKPTSDNMKYEILKISQKSTEMAKVTTVDFDAAVKPQNSSIYIGPKQGKERVGGKEREGGRKAAFENGKKSAQSFLLQCEKY